MKSDKRSSDEPAEAPPRPDTPEVPTGDCALDFMIKNGIPLTRENYLAVNYFDPNKQLSAEEEAELPEMFQLDPVEWEYTMSTEDCQQPLIDVEALAQKQADDLAEAY